MAVNVFITNTNVCNISRTDIIEWVNSSLRINYSRVEQLGTGAAYCQLMHMMWPHCIQLKKVKFNSILDHEFINNFKLLQTSFNCMSVDKVVPMEKLTKMKFQDNFEFAQWFKKFFDMNYNGLGYDPLAARGGKSEGESVNRTAMSPRPTKQSEKHITITSRTVVRERFREDSQMHVMTRQNIQPREDSQISVTNRQLEEIKESLLELQLTVQSLTKEKEFYLKKLRDIESFCQDHEDLAAIQSVMEIMYATEVNTALTSDSSRVDSHTNSHIPALKDSSSRHTRVTLRNRNRSRNRNSDVNINVNITIDKDGDETKDGKTRKPDGGLGNQNATSDSTRSVDSALVLEAEEPSESPLEFCQESPLEFCQRSELSEEGDLLPPVHFTEELVDVSQLSVAMTTETAAKRADAKDDYDDNDDDNASSYDNDSETDTPSENLGVRKDGPGNENEDIVNIAEALIDGSLAMLGGLGSDKGEDDREADDNVINKQASLDTIVENIEEIVSELLATDMLAVKTDGDDVDDKDKYKAEDDESNDSDDESDIFYDVDSEP